MSNKKMGGLAGLAASIVSAFSLSVAPAAQAQESFPSPDLSLPTIITNAPPAKTLADFGVMQCYAPDDLREYLTLSGEEPIVKFERTSSVRYGPMMIEIPSQAYIIADQDSWSFLIEGIAANQGKICLADRGETLEYVSMRDKYYQKASLNSETSISETRKLELENYEKQFGQTPFLKGISESGSTFDVLASMGGSWAILLTQPDGNTTQRAFSGHNYEMIRPNFENTFGLFHLDNYVLPEHLIEPVI